ncbi:jg16116 [Pararge aegeria aegeria]|uniref:Jg16116 protein n=1 Tax=Pararge aegeria aegeria TaxID=348720 RepID=A0A8S4RG82_9NEOP|nr:jg16116 [Pararge aegeria aegeria]
MFKGKWIPYFQGVFTCHAPVKVHLDVQSSLPYSTFSVYNNDTGKQMPQVYNAHITFHFEPNDHGYTIMGHGTLNEAPSAYTEVQWQLTVLSSTADVFHICDSDMIESCRELPLPQSSKMHIDEIFIPNRRNILGGMQISVQREEYISFRAAATLPELEMEAILSTTLSEGGFQELGRCSGTGVLQWPYIKLESAHMPYSLRRAKTRSATSHANLTSPCPYWRTLTHAGFLTMFNLPSPFKAPRESVFSSARSLKTPRGPKASTKSKSMTKDKNKTEELYQPQPGDAYVELECSLAVGGGSQAKRDDERELQFAAERKSWDVFEPGRNLRGAQIRKEFRAEFLEALTPPPSESSQTVAEEIYEELEGEGKTFELSTESEVESTYLTMPEQLKDKFEPLYFVPLCTKEIESIRVTLTPGMLQAAVSTRNTNIEAALQRMSELQTYNEAYVLGRQKYRCQLLEKLFVDSQWKLELNQALEERDDAIAREVLQRSLSATKKKMEAKKK